VYLRALRGFEDCVNHQGHEGTRRKFHARSSDVCERTTRRRGATEKSNKLKVEYPPEPAVRALEGSLSAAGKRFAIVVSRFNAFITERLFQSAYDGLLRSGAKRKDIVLVRVPGSFEIPSAARTLAETRKYDAIICIGCLLRGDTAHYDVIVNEVTRGIGQSAQETGVPHAFGVLTCDTLEQAIDRAGLKMGNKGFEAALAAVEMANLTTAISHRPSAVSKTATSRQPSAVRKGNVPTGSKKRTRRR
jgi:6,7-dimethyl-8-ribityllumazine synthase